MQLKEGVRIELKHVTKAYGDKPVLKGLNLGVEAGETLVVSANRQLLRSGDLDQDQGRLYGDGDRGHGQGPQCLHPEYPARALGMA